VGNGGQVDDRVAFYAPTFAGTVFVTHAGELVYSLDASSAGGWSLTETLVGGRARPVGRDRGTTGIGYFVGDDPARGRADVRSWERVSLGEVWPGVTVSLRARGRSVEKVFTVERGGRVDRIRVGVAGASGLAVDAHGALIARTGLGAVTFTAPIAYQE